MLRDSSRGRLVKQGILLLDESGLVLTSFPAFTPVAHQKLEAESVYLHAGLETYSQIPEIHLVLIGVGGDPGEMLDEGAEGGLMNRRQPPDLRSKHREVVCDMFIYVMVRSGPLA